MNKNLIMVSLCLIFLIGVVSAIPIPSPHGFHGIISYSNGTLIEEGTILAKINEGLVGSSDIIDGSYDLIVESEYGEIINFYFEDELIGNYTFKAFEVTELNFVINIEESEDETEEPTHIKASKSFWQISLDKQFCEPNWKCSAWGECENNWRTRKCSDTNHCVYSYNKPIENTDCGIISSVLVEQQEEKTNWIFISSGVIITLILSIILVNLLKKK